MGLDLTGRASGSARRGFRLALAAVAFGLAVGAPAGASAALYASPAGSGADCSEGSPCSLQTAIATAASGDDVFVLADQGDYRLPSGIATRVGVPIHIHGLNGRARLIFAAGGLRLKVGSAHGLYVEGNSNSTAFALDNAGASADRVFAKNGATGHACYLKGGTLTNSVCWAGSTGDKAIETDGSNTLRNVTAVGGTEAAIEVFARDECSCATATVTLVNVIARSGPTGVDLVAESDGSVVGNINLSYSNYETTEATGPFASMIHITGGATNQTAPPLFVNAAAGDFREDPASPTIDAGTNDPANGVGDLDGNPRTLGGRTDVGAYELVPAVAVPPDTTITRAKIKTKAREATFGFAAVGEADGFQCALVKRKSKGQPKFSFSSCESPRAYRNLKPGRYIFAVRAFNSAGNDATPATRMFRI